MLFASPHYERSALDAVLSDSNVPNALLTPAAQALRERNCISHAATDDMIDWAEMNADGLRSGFACARFAKLAAEAVNDRHTAEMAAPDVDAPPSVVRGPRQPRIPARRRRSRWGRVLRELLALLLSPRAFKGRR